jgi:hypothetical protein
MANAGQKGFTDRLILERTGKRTGDWVEILERFNEGRFNQMASARHLREKYNLPTGWAQAVVERFEFATGIRKR